MPRFSLGSITRGAQPLPPRLVVYGPHGVGKTTFAASAPSAVVIRTEDGLATIDVPTFPIARSYGDVIEAIGTLYSEAHPFATAVLDSLDWLEPLVWAETARAHGKDDIEAFGYGKGYLHASETWQTLLDGLDALRGKGMTVILIAHAEIKRFDAPDTEPYDRYQIKLHKRASELVQEWADVVAFAHHEVFTQQTDAGFNKKITRGVGSGRRLLSVDERPAYYAKNRYRLPPDLPLTWGAFQDAVSAAYGPGLGGAVASAGSAESAAVPSASVTDDSASLAHDIAMGGTPEDMQSLDGAPGGPAHSDDCALGIGGTCDCPALYDGSTPSLSSPSLSSAQ